MGFLCRHCGNTFERLEHMEIHSERCWKANKAHTFCNCLMMRGVECNCFEEYSELNKRLLKEKEIKEAGNDFYAMLHSLGDSREIEMAKLKLEECVMWAVNGVCNND